VWLSDCIDVGGLACFCAPVEERVPRSRTAALPEASGRKDQTTFGSTGIPLSDKAREDKREHGVTEVMWEHAYRNAIGTGEKFGVRRLAAASCTVPNPEAPKRVSGSRLPHAKLRLPLTF
jgi:hypothetical protein